MAFDWGEYLAMARFLGEHTGDPHRSQTFSDQAAIRSAISRAYYAAFCSARSFAQRRLSYNPSGSAGDHSGLRRHLRATNRRQLADHLGRLQAWREHCDYDDADLENAHLLLRDALAQAQRVLDACR